jgi:hypothetical protein
MLAAIVAFLTTCGATASAIAGASGEGAATAPASSQTPSAASASAPAAVVDWLERAARVYQEEIADRLAVPREPSANGTAAAGSGERARRTGFAGALKTGVEQALGYVSFWVRQAEAALGPPLTELAYGLVGTPADRAASDADAFVDARRKADEQWKHAVAQADAAARRATGPSNASGETPAEAELRRAEARKAELAKIKEDLDRRIAEGLKKLEEFQKREQGNKASLLTPPAGPDLPAQNAPKPDADEEKARAEQVRVAAEKERAHAEAEAARKAEDARMAEQARRQEAEDEQREAAAKAEQARLAEDEARKRAEAELAARKAEDARRREAQAAEEKRLADANAEAAHRAEERRAEETRRAEEEERANAERAAQDRERKQLAEAEQARQDAENARRRADAQAAEKRASETRETEAKKRWAEAGAVPEKRKPAEPDAAQGGEPRASEPDVAVSEAAKPRAADRTASVAEGRDTGQTAPPRQGRGTRRAREARGVSRCFPPHRRHGQDRRAQYLTKEDTRRAPQPLPPRRRPLRAQEDGARAGAPHSRGRTRRDAMDDLSASHEKRRALRGHPQRERPQNSRSRPHLSLPAASASRACVRQRRKAPSLPRTAPPRHDAADTHARDWSPRTKEAKSPPARPCANGRQRRVRDRPGRAIRNVRGT